MLSRKRRATDPATHSGTEKRIRSDSSQQFLDLSIHSTAALSLRPQHEAGNVHLQCSHKRSSKCSQLPLESRASFWRLHRAAVSHRAGLCNWCIFRRYIQRIILYYLLPTLRYMECGRFADNIKFTQLKRVFIGLRFNTRCTKFRVIRTYRQRC
ncbi:hypothetical protein GQ44DRAFT_63806 [Phaeosphaeriaceae sp. PMI808]|nr:hypothetical protein GQ44DRAFT_63806 [Phaeosphaeriaceae sp. PMI808]